MMYGRSPVTYIVAQHGIANSMKVFTIASPGHVGHGHLHAASEVAR